MWVRGLKQEGSESRNRVQPVAPHVGAWIETPLLKISLYQYYVAPHVGAWIETSI